MWPFGKKKKSEVSVASDPQVQNILRDALMEQGRVENAPVGVGVVKRTGASCAFVKNLGKTLREDLGGDGRVLFSYEAAENKLVLYFTFLYQEGSEEIKLVEECLDSMDTESEDTLVGDVTGYCINYITSRPVTEIVFYAENVARTDLKEAADRLLSHVFDWLDIVYEAFEEEFGEE